MEKITQYQNAEKQKKLIQKIKMIRDLADKTIEETLRQAHLTVEKIKKNL